MVGYKNPVKKSVRQGGWIKSEIYISEDFNDTFEIVSEKEIHVLNAMRTKPDLQGVAV